MCIAVFTNKWLENVQELNWLIFAVFKADSGMMVPLYMCVYICIPKEVQLFDIWLKLHGRNDKTGYYLLRFFSVRTGKHGEGVIIKPHVLFPFILNNCLYLKMLLVTGKGQKVSF